MTVLAIDPGNQQSAYCLIGSDRKPIAFGLLPNDELHELIGEADWGDLRRVAVEMVASYGMAVGKDVFETCVWIGRFVESWWREGFDPELITRLPVKLHHCHTAKANDANIRQALVDRFASGIPNHGKGTKAQPGWFYGFAADIWAAYALAVFAADTGADTGAAT